MPDYRHAYTPSGAISLTLATFNRRPIFADWVRHINYLRYNPVKHESVDCLHQWELLSFQQLVKDGFCREDSGCRCGGKATAVEFEWEGLVVGE